MHAEELRAGHCPLILSDKANASCVHVLFRFVKGDYVVCKHAVNTGETNKRLDLVSNTVLQELESRARFVKHDIPSRHQKMAPSLYPHRPEIRL
jgi:hypothetical protein